MPEPEQGIEPGDDAMSLNPGSRGVLERIVLACGAVTAGAGVMILVGWAIGSDTLTAMGTGYIAAPNTALLFALLGSAVLAREVWPASRGIHYAVAAAALFSVVVASLTLIGFAIGLNIDDWLFRTTRMLGAVPMGRMSPVTAFCFILGGISLLLLEYQARTRAAIPGTLITLAGAVCLMGYWFGAPLFYGGTVIPVALPTSLALVALGVGTTAAAGPGAWPLSTLIGPSTRARLLRTLLPPVILLALINDWITAILLEHSDPGIVLASATTATAFLLVVGLVVSRVSRTIGDAVDRTDAERKRAEEMLRASEGKFRSIFEGALDGILVAERGTRKFLSGNPAICRMIGYTLEEIVRIGVSNIHPKQELPRAMGQFERLLRGESQMAADIPVMRKDGSVFYADIKAAPIRIGGQDGLLGIFRDVTERRQIERELQHKTKLAQLLEQLARAANEAVSPEAAMETCLRRICDYGNWALGRVATFRTAEPRSKAEHSQWFCTEPARFDAFMRYSDGYEFMGGRSVYINRVLRDQRPAWLPDLTALDTAKLLRLAMAVKAGLRAAFAFPVIVRGEVAAFLEFFATERRQPDALLIDGTSGLASQFARLVERHRFEESRARLAAIVEYSNDAIIGRAIDGTITSWNAAAERIFGYTAAEVVGRDPVEIFPLELRQKIAAHRKLLNAGQSVPEYETVRINKDGRRVNVAASIFAIKDNSGSIIGTATILRDITPRIEAEKALRKHYELLDRIFATTQLCLVYLDRDFNFVRVNEAYAAACGHPPEFFAGKNHFELYLDEKVVAIFRRVVATGEPFSIYANPFEFPGHPERGVTYWDWTLHPLKREDGCVEGLLFALLDVTARKRSEEALRSYSVRLRELSRRLRDVEESERRAIARELHDRIGQGLTTLSLMVGVLDARLSRESQSAVQTLLKDMQSLLQNVVAHVRDVMAELRPPVLDDYGLLAALRNLVTEFANRTGIAVSLGGVDPHPRLPLIVETAMFRISQEALNNIAKHADAKKVEISLNAVSDRIVLDIADDGVGFDTSKMLQGREHWGMITMRERAEAVGITFRLESAPGAGTRIVLDAEQAAS